MAEVLSVGEVIDELQKYPRDAVVCLAMCMKKNKIVKKPHCARDLLATIDFQRNAKGDPDTGIVLLHGET